MSRMIKKYRKYGFRTAIGSALNVYPAKSYSESLDMSMTDAQRLYSDWVQVGQNLRRARKRYDLEHGLYPSNTETNHSGNAGATGKSVV